MKKNLRWVVLGLSVAGMGMAMPSCPGQQAMQQQIDTLQTSNTDLQKKVTALTKEVATLTAEMNQAKELLPKMSTVVQAQREALEKLKNSVHVLREKKKKKKK